jgi:hypothetical protein
MAPARAAQWRASRLCLPPLTLSGYRIAYQDRENPGFAACAAATGAEGETAPVNSQAQGTVLDDNSGERRATRPPTG